MTRPKTQRVLQLAREKGILRASDLEAKGLTGRYLPRLEQRGQLERVARSSSITISPSPRRPSRVGLFVSFRRSGFTS